MRVLFAVFQMIKGPLPHLLTAAALVQAGLWSACNSSSFNGSNASRDSLMNIAKIQVTSYQ